MGCDPTHRPPARAIRTRRRSSCRRRTASMQPRSLRGISRRSSGIAIEQSTAHNDAVALAFSVNLHHRESAKSRSRTARVGGRVISNGERSRATTECASSRATASAWFSVVESLPLPARSPLSKRHPGWRSLDTSRGRCRRGNPVITNPLVADGRSGKTPG